jgi:hypothetical protein
MVLCQRAFPARDSRINDSLHEARTAAFLSLVPLSLLINTFRHGDGSFCAFTASAELMNRAQKNAR